MVLLESYTLLEEAVDDFVVINILETDVVFEVFVIALEELAWLCDTVSFEIELVSALGEPL